RCAGVGYYLTAVATVVPFVVIPVAVGSVVTLVLVNVFPARRARDILTLMGLLFAMALVMMLRFLRPERLLSVESLPDVAAFFSTLQSPVTPLLPSFWAGETLFAALQGGHDTLHAGALWTTALAFLVLARAAYSRWYFTGWRQAQGGAQGALHRPALPGHAGEPAARRAAGAADVREGPQGVPARHHAVVAAAPAGRAHARLRLQLPRPRPGSHPLHVRPRQER